MDKCKILKIAVGLFAASLITACDSTDYEQPVSQPIRTTVEMPAPSPNVITVRGMVESTETRNVYSTLGFMIDRVYVEVGDRVAEGQILGMLDTANLELTIAQ